VGRHSINSAEAGFFESILSEGTSVIKKAVQLDPEVAEALDIPSVSPKILEELERQAAAQEAKPKAKPQPEPKAPASVEGEVYEPSPQEFLQDPEPAKPEAAELEEYERKEPPVKEEAPSPDLPSRATHGKLFTDKRAHPLQLFDTLNMRYKEDWAGWEPETLQWAIRRDFGSIGELTLNKIQALGLAGRTDVPWLDWDVFENAGLAWNDIVPIFGAFQAMTPMQVAFAVHVLKSVRDEPFAHEVNAYIAAILDDHGFVYAPKEWFAGAQEILSKGTKVLGIKGEVEDAWPRIKNVPPEEVDWNYENALDVHLMKLAVINRYLEERKLLRKKVPGVAMASTTIDPLVT
jgi:hypothetical protein